MSRFGLLFAVLSFLAAPSGRAGEPAAPAAGPALDKSRYTLFHPTPDSLLRDFNPDRPSQFTGPYTVDAGRFELEASAVAYTLDRHNPERVPVDVDQWNLAPAELRVGLTEHTEVDLIHGGYLDLRTRDRSARTDQTQSGFGDLTLQGKYCLVGDDGGAVAFGVLPYLKVPTNTDRLGNKYVEGGVLLPVAVSLPYNFGLGVQTEFDALRNGANTRYEANFTNIVTVSYDLISKRLQVFGELYSRVNAGSDSQVVGQVDGGVILFVGKNLEFDAACNFGVTRAAPDFVPFAGFSVRF